MLDCTALLVSTDPRLHQVVTAGLETIDHLRLEVCGALSGALPHLERDDLALVMIHLRPDSDEGEITRLVQSLAARKTPCATLLFSDEYHDHQAVVFLRAGAADYLSLPVGPGRLAYLMTNLTLRARLGRREQVAAAADLLGDAESLHFVVAPEMTEQMEQIRHVGPQDTTLLLTGETGTGKTRLARLIHELSPRRDEPFLVIDCGALSANLIESEMFGHVKGAFTGADRDRPGKFLAAGDGTLLLDEVNSLPPALQAKLLRAVDERVFEPVGANKSQPLRARLIAASNKPLEREVSEGRFRADLYYRLNVVGFYLAPLRERRGAIAALANKFLAEFTARNGRPIYQIAPDALRALEAFDWPGNIRELRNVIERAVALCPGSEVQVRDLPEVIRGANPYRCPTEPVHRASVPFAPRLSPPTTLAARKKEAEVSRILEALEKHKNNRLRAAAELGISRMALYKKLHKYGLMGAG
jgi:DNA-binding NtrC family response regulator